VKRRYVQTIVDTRPSLPRRGKYYQVRVNQVNCHEGLSVNEALLGGNIEASRQKLIGDGSVPSREGTNRQNVGRGPPTSRPISWMDKSGGGGGADCLSP